MWVQQACVVGQIEAQARPSPAHGGDDGVQRPMVENDVHDGGIQSMRGKGRVAQRWCAHQRHRHRRSDRGRRWRRAGGGSQRRPEEEEIEEEDPASGSGPVRFGDVHVLLLRG